MLVLTVLIVLIVLIAKVQILLKFHKILWVDSLFSYLIQDSTLCLVALSGFSCMQQILINSFSFLFCYKYFLIFLVKTS